MEQNKLKNIIEAALMAVDEPLPFERIQAMFDPNLEEVPNRQTVKDVVALLQADYQDRGIELKEVASGYRIQVASSYAEWINRLWEDRPPKYSRALLETLAIIAYRQPVTRGEIEDIRGVSVSTNIIRVLLEREWVRVAGHRDVPGRPAVYVTTRQFLDYFNLKGLSELPELPELRDLDEIAPDMFATQTGQIGGQESPLVAVVSDSDQTDGEGQAQGDSSATDETESGDAVDSETTLNSEQTDPEQEAVTEPVEADELSAEQGEPESGQELDEDVPDTAVVEGANDASSEEDESSASDLHGIA